MRAEVTLSDDANVRLEVLQEGEVAFASPWRPNHGGDVPLEISLPGLAPGRYEVRAAASDGVDTIRSETRPVVITGDASPSPVTRPTAPAEPRPTSEERTWLWLAAALAAGLLLVALLVIAARRRPQHR
jgi:hypothetical protein